MKRRLLLSGAGALAASAASGALAQQVLVPTNPPAPVAALSITYTQISTIIVPVPAFRTVGYSTPGVGDALFVKGSSSGPMAVQDLSGQWFEMAQTGEWDAKAWAAKGDGTDDTTRLNAWLAGCVTYGQNGFAPPGIYLNTGLTFDCTAAVAGLSKAITIRGAHMSQSVFRMIAGSTNDHLTIKTANNYAGLAMPVVRDLTFDGVGYYGGHGIHCYTAWDGSNLAAVGQSVILENLTIKFPGKDGLFTDTVTNYFGQATNVWVSHAGRHGFNINSSNWKLIACKSYGADRAGKAVTGATNNGSGLVRLTVTAHGMTTGQTAHVYLVAGVSAATGTWAVTVIDANTIDLQGSTFSGTYTSGGHCVGVWSIASVADNGSGAARITTTAPHPYAVGDQVFIRSAGGVPNANGGWTVLAVPNSTTFDLDYGELLLAKGWTSALNGQTYTSGGTVHSFSAAMYFGPYAQGPGGCMFSMVELYTSFMGLVMTSESGDPMQFLQGDIFNNWLEGITAQNFGISPLHSFSGRMAANSSIAGGGFSDILVSNTGGLQFNMSHINIANQVKYLLENDGTCVDRIFFNPVMDTTGAHPAYLTAMTNATDAAHSTINVATSYGSSIASGTGNIAFRYADAGGRSNAASALYSFVRGWGNGVNAQYGAAFGVQGKDQGMLSLVYGGTQFTSQGDNQARVAVIASAITTGATPRSLLISGNVDGATAASGANTLNLFINFQTAAYDRITIMCKNPATGDTKTWVVDNLVAKRGASISAITLNGSASTINPSAAYTSDAALSACTVSLAPDTTNGGIAVTGTGIAATTLHWSLKASPLEVV